MRSGPGESASGLPAPPLEIRTLGARDVETLLPELVSLLQDGVDSGGSLGFFAPLAGEEARSYWLSVGKGIEDESLVLLVASSGPLLAGTGQLALASLPNARHRAILQKLCVASTVRGRGIGRRLMAALHEAALARGRTLVLLNTRLGEPPEAFYRRLGYQEVGVVPGYTIGTRGEAHDTVILYRQLGER